jgi:DNA ligase (NAD+)
MPQSQLNLDASEPSRLDQLRTLIAEYDDAYYKNHTSPIPDQEYDALKSELQTLERAEGNETEVGSDLQAGFAHHSHLLPMLSLGNTYSEDELTDFLSKLVEGQQPEVIIEPKIDGVSISLTFEQGLLTKAVTRGNKTQGDVVTNNILAFTDIPRQLRGNFPPLIEIRGEVYMDYAEFERINAVQEEHGQALYANPRNLTSGTVKNLRGNFLTPRKLKVIAYALGGGAEGFFPSMTQFRAFLSSQGFTISNSYLGKTPTEVWYAITDLDARRKELPYPTDGAVIKINDIQLQDELGLGTNSPKWAIAYKYAPEQGLTKLLAIDLQVGRTGTITPVARLKPVYLSGSTVSNATLHNFNEIERKDIRIGDSVYVQKAGEIIPQIVSVELSERSPDSIPYVFPTHLADGSAIIRDKGDAAHRLADLSHPDIIQQQVEYFASKECLDIQHLGTQVVQLLLQHKLIHTLGDIYRLTAADLEGVGHIQAKLAAKLIASITASKSQPAERVLAALGAPHVGTTTAKLLLRSFSLTDLCQLKDPSLLSNLEGIGDVTAADISNYFQSEAIQALIADLATQGLNMAMEKLDTKHSDHITGRTFVVTGTLSLYKRTEVQKLIEMWGGKCSSSVSKKTDALLAGDAAGSKLAKAEKLGVLVISEATFASWIA